MAPFLTSLIEENKLGDREYIEPYAGGAAVALTLLLEKYVPHITINDYDLSMYAFWDSVVSKGDKLCGLIEDTPVTMDSWHEQKEVQRNKKKENLLKLGFSTFFLNRTNFSGVIEGRVIGGKSQSGPYSLDVRFNKNELIRRIKYISDHRKNITVTQRDALDILKDSNGIKDKFIYLDPPYYQKGHVLYANFYKPEDHEKVAQTLLSKCFKCRWVLSYDRHDSIRDLYKKCRNRFSWSPTYTFSNQEHNEDIFLHPKLKTTKSSLLVSAYN